MFVLQFFLQYFHGSKMKALKKRFEALELAFLQLKEKSDLQEKEIISLRERLSRHEISKNSRNSSIPPSKDENRPKPNQSLREVSGKKPGGQKGHLGKTLEMTATPDVVIDLKPKFCDSCGLSLEGLPATKERFRQVVDIPPIKAVWTEYQTFGKTCSCGCQTISDFPSAANAPVSYGENIEALIAYFHARQYLPFHRMQELLRDVFGTSISEGGIHRLLERFAQKTSPLYQAIKQGVEDAPMVGADETGVKVNGERDWFWAWQTPKHTYIAYSDNRGSATIEKEFPKGFPKSTLGHDDYAAQAKTLAKAHQTCLSHLQRRLKYLCQKYPDDPWPKQFLEMLFDSLKLKAKLDFTKTQNPERDAILQRFDKLLENPPQKKHKEAYAFFKTRTRSKESLFTFLHNQEVPPDNNGSERAIRNVKVKQKISGQFKTPRTAQNFAKIRSVIDTTIKNGMVVLDTLALIAKFDLQVID